MKVVLAHHAWVACRYKAGCEQQAAIQLPPEEVRGKVAAPAAPLAKLL